MTSPESAPRGKETPASLLARMKAGTLSRRRVQLAAALGNELAFAVASPAGDPDPVRAALQELDVASQRLLTCDEAERLLSKATVIDERCWNAVATARRYATGKATPEELAVADDSACAAFLEQNALVEAAAIESEAVPMSTLLQVIAVPFALRATVAPSKWSATWADIAVEIWDETRGLMAAHVCKVIDAAPANISGPEEIRSWNAIRQRQLARLAECLLRDVDPML